MNEEQFKELVYTNGDPIDVGQPVPIEFDTETNTYAIFRDEYREQLIEDIANRVAEKLCYASDKTDE